MNHITLHLADGSSFVVNEVPQYNSSGPDHGEQLDVVGASVHFVDGSVVTYGRNLSANKVTMPEEVSTAPEAQPEVAPEVATETVSDATPAEEAAPADSAEATPA